MANEREIHEADLLKYIAMDASELPPITYALIARERIRIGSPIWKWFRAFDLKCRDPLNIDWRMLACIDDTSADANQLTPTPDARLKPIINIRWKSPDSLPTTLLAFAAFLMRLARQQGLRTVATTRSASQITVPLNDLEQALEAGEPVTLRDEHKWIRLRYEGGDLFIRAGDQPTSPFTSFCCVFYRADIPILVLRSDRGAICVRSTDLDSATAMASDRVVVISTDIQ